jgi:hypothetical protein
MTFRGGGEDASVLLVACRRSPKCLIGVKHEQGTPGKLGSVSMCYVCIYQFTCPGSAANVSRLFTERYVGGERLGGVAQHLYHLSIGMDLDRMRDRSSSRYVQ